MLSALLLTMSLQAQAEKHLSCTGWIIDSLKSENSQSAKLIPQKFDKKFWQAQIGDIVFAVDTYYLKNDALHLIISRHDNDDVAKTLAGFRKLEGSQTREASVILLTQIKQQPVELQLICDETPK